MLDETYFLQQLIVPFLGITYASEAVALDMTQRVLAIYSRAIVIFNNAPSLLLS